MRGIFVRLALCAAVPKDGSCAIEGCESCQVGNQAALSSLFDVPRGCLSRAAAASNTYEDMLEFRVYGLTMQLLFIFLRRRKSQMHLALYRKWRSSDFDDVCGQEHITSTLRYEVEHNMISHAYLFSGPRGTGKTSCAKILSRAVNCERPVNGNPCNECYACRSIMSGSAVDVVEMDAASNNGVDYIRDIRDEVVFTPAELRYRVYIVDEVHMLSPAAYNALLKTLEEPPQHVIFILATTELHKLPETIISRCQRFEFHRLTVPVISARLSHIAKAEGLTATPGALDEIARIANGGMRDAISHLELCAGRHAAIDEALVSDVFGKLGYEQVAAAAKAVSERDYDAIFSIISELTAAGRDISVFWDELSSFYRDMLIMKTTKEPSRFLDISEASMNSLKATAELFSVTELLYQCRLIDDTAAEITRKAGSKRLCVELALVRMCDPSLSVEPDALLSRITSLEDRLALISAGGVVTVKTKTAKSAEPAVSEKTPPKKATAAVKPEVPASTASSEPTPIPYFGELMSRAVEKKPPIEGFRQFITGYRSDDEFVIECANPFTMKICSDNKPMFVELFTIFEGRLVGENEVKIKTNNSGGDRAPVSLDSLL